MSSIQKRVEIKAEESAKLCGISKAKTERLWLTECQGHDL